MKDEGMSKGLIFGFLAGGALGAILALLYAPKSGKEFRSDIKVKSDELLTEAEKQLEIAKEKAKVLINDGKKKSEEIVGSAKEKSNKILQDAEKLYENVLDKTTKVVSTGKEKIELETERIKTSVKAGVDAYQESKNA
ncbi:MAG: YtxH domain-containing protein [Bacteroidota bacterium]|nr:YtxH domain-containing protein [Bacteroidota bacterium]